MVKYETPKELELNNPRLFNERAHLDFSFIYDNGESGVNSSFRVRIPLYENPSITESKQSRLGTYKPIGRNSDLYSFLGAESTNLSLNFNLTLPHIIHQCEKFSITDYTKILKADDKESFKADKPKTKQPILDPKNIVGVIKAFQTSYFLGNNPENVFQNVVIQNQSTGASRDVVLFRPGEEAESEKETKVKALYYFWTNIIRCSVIGTSDHKGGPPIVRFSYGPFYKRVPFIVKKYQFTIDEKAGYDVSTLLPLRLKVSLSMEEIRVGNFSDYKTYNDPENFGTLEDSENVAGWEHVLANGSLNPLYSNIAFEEDS